MNEREKSKKVINNGNYKRQDQVKIMHRSGKNKFRSSSMRGTSPQTTISMYKVYDAYSNRSFNKTKRTTF